ncbi:hypothetical protein SARC_15197 [Sphaeroforma arctica JP610]|uniref:Bromo domain-containing protein n=1 Tax=Sphaeroforma arctica JP610 TaxID=667725 RepID=A0A0L0F6Q5_9EUKA|nr:hypothetical protein SARC_15197 [Sphaeroforma arctica JP610]KNC72251.1 hypothetical protein SARC_15197 [Sphaeroforma arctica JP610]|eukprot:XP_014146153.1 hypothetical protein SARC_15197 [Sphaeroforma arctica JP610]
MLHGNTQSATGLFAVPVTLTTILNKCEKGKYENVEMFEQDFEEMLSMSKSSLHVSTRALKDVKVMEELFVNAQSNAVAALNTDCDMHLTQNTDVESQIGAAEVVAVGEPLLSALCDAKAKRSRKLVDMFMKLPSRRQVGTCSCLACF